jgi:hypothetical protein
LDEKAGGSSIIMEAPLVVRRFMTADFVKRQHRFQALDERIKLVEEFKDAVGTQVLSTSFQRLRRVKIKIKTEGD